jgi:hypothetical protein
MKRTFSILLTLGLLGASHAVTAQSLSAADIAAMVDERMGGVDEYAALLDDPDPDRSLAAMQIMIGLGDPQISRMALQHGLTSTNPAVRRAALKGYFDTQPNLEFYIDGSNFDLAGFTTRMANVSGSVDANGNGFMTFRVGAFEDGMNFYVYQNWPNLCLVQLSESSVTITAWRKATSFKLDETGLLIGDMLVDNLTPAATTTIPVRQ